MQAGLAQHRVGTFLDGKNSAHRRGQSRVQLDLPGEDDDAAIVEFHNRLMRLCRLGYRTLCEQVMKKDQKTRSRQVAGAGGVDNAVVPLEAGRLAVGLAPAPFGQ